MSLVCVLVGAWLAVQGLKVNGGVTWGDLQDRSKLRAALDPGARVGIALVVIGAVLNTAASIGSLYLPA